MPLHVFLRFPQFRCSASLNYGSELQYSLTPDLVISESLEGRWTGKRVLCCLETISSANFEAAVPKL